MTNTIRSAALVLISAVLSLVGFAGTASAMTPCTDPAGCAPGGSLVIPVTSPSPITGPDKEYIELCLAALGYADPLAAPVAQRKTCGDLFKPAPVVAPKTAAKTAAKPAVKAPASAAAKPAAKKSSASSGSSSGSSSASKSTGSSAAKKPAAKSPTSHSSPAPARSGGVPRNLVPRYDSPGA